MSAVLLKQTSSYLPKPPLKVLGQARRASRSGHPLKRLFSNLGGPYADFHTLTRIPETVVSVCGDFGFLAGLRRVVFRSSTTPSQHIAIKPQA